MKAILRSSSIISFIRKCHSGSLNLPHIYSSSCSLLCGATARQPWTVMPGHPNESKVDQGPNSCSWPDERGFKVYQESSCMYRLHNDRKILETDSSFMRLLIALYKTVVWQCLTCIHQLHSFKSFQKMLPTYIALTGSASVPGTLPTISFDLKISPSIKLTASHLRLWQFDHHEQGWTWSMRCLGWYAKHG